MKSFWMVLTVVAVMVLSDTGVDSRVFAGDVISPTLKGQDDKYQKAGQPQAMEDDKDAQAVEEEQVDGTARTRDWRVRPRRRGPHDDRLDPYGRRLGPEEDLENRYGRRDGRYDGQDKLSGRLNRQPGEVWQQNNPLYGRYEKAPTPRAWIQQQRLKSHFRNHYRHSRYYQQAYNSSHSSRFRHFNDSRYRSYNSAESRSQRSPYFLPYRYR